MKRENDKNQGGDLARAQLAAPDNCLGVRFIPPPAHTKMNQKEGEGEKKRLHWRKDRNQIKNLKKVEELGGRDSGWIGAHGTALFK